MAHLLPLPRLRFFDTNGVPLVGGKLYSYAAGTSTLQATYTNQAESGTNSNPVVLDANGEASIWIGSSAYKFVLKDASDVTIWTADGVSTVNSGSITTAKLADGSVTTLKIADGAITTSKIPDLAVTTAKLNDGAVTAAKRAALGQQISLSSASATTTSGTYTDVLNLSVTIATSGRPIMVFLQSDGTSAVESHVGWSRTSAGAGANVTGGAIFKILRDATDIAFFQIGGVAVANSSGSYFTDAPAGCINHLDTPTAGTYTYKLQYKATGGGAAVCAGCKLVAFEL